MITNRNHKIEHAMSRPSEEVEAERERLREQARNAESPEERHKAIRRLAKLDRERNADTYETLARE